MSHKTLSNNVYLIFLSQLLSLNMPIIQYCSDLHIEFPHNRDYLKQHPIEPVGEILVLAGDVVPFIAKGEFEYFLDKLARDFKEVYWIAGNHEFYHSDIKGYTGSFCKKLKRNLFLVNNHQIQVGNTRLLFSTLWTKISKQFEWEIANSMSDFHIIKDHGNRFTPRRASDLFEENIAFLRSTMSEKQEGVTTIVVTHHVPTFKEYPEKYKGSVLSEGFAVELTSFIENSAIDYWIYGHHHFNTPPFRVGNTQMLTNQLGYVSQGEHSNYNSNCCIEVN